VLGISKVKQKESDKDAKPNAGVLCRKVRETSRGSPDSALRKKTLARMTTVFRILNLQSLSFGFEPAGRRRYYSSPHIFCFRFE